MTCIMILILLKLNPNDLSTMDFSREKKEFSLQGDEITRGGNFVSILQLQFINLWLISHFLNICKYNYKIRMSEIYGFVFETVILSLEFMQRMKV